MFFSSFAFFWLCHWRWPLGCPQEVAIGMPPKDITQNFFTKDRMKNVPQGKEHINGKLKRTEGTQGVSKGFERKTKNLWVSSDCKGLQWKTKRSRLGSYDFKGNFGKSLLVKGFQGKAQGSHWASTEFKSNSNENSRDSLTVPSFGGPGGSETLTRAFGI